MGPRWMSQVGSVSLRCTTDDEWNEEDDDDPLLHLDRTTSSNPPYLVASTSSRLTVYIHLYIDSQPPLETSRVAQELPLWVYTAPRGIDIVSTIPFTYHGVSQVRLHPSFGCRNLWSFLVAARRILRAPRANLPTIPTFVESPLCG